MRNCTETNQIVFESLYNLYIQSLLYPDEVHEVDIQNIPCELEKNTYQPLGYGYLHGTEYFSYKGSAQIVDGQFVYTIDCTWDDEIDPNYSKENKLEKPLVNIANWFWEPADYKISVKWSLTNENSYHLFEDFWNKKNEQQNGMNSRG